jgi:hypothetical protein
MGSAQSCLPRPQQNTAQKPAAKASFGQGANKRERFVVLVGPGKHPATRAVEPEHGDRVQEAPKKQAAKQQVSCKYPALPLQAAPCRMCTMPSDVTCQPQGAEKPERLVVLVAGGAPRLAAKPPTMPDATQPQVAEQQASCKTSAASTRQPHAWSVLFARQELRLRHAPASAVLVPGSGTPPTPRTGARAHIVQRCRRLPRANSCANIQMLRLQVAGAKSNTLSASDTPGRQLRRQWKAARQAAVRKCSGQGAGNPERFVVLFAGGKVLQAARAAEPEHGNGDNQAAGQRTAAQQAAEEQAVEKQDAEQRAVEQQVLEQQAGGNQAVQQQAARQHVVQEQVDEQQGIEYLDAKEEVDEEPLPDEQVLRCKAWCLINTIAPC